jgi:hypothetical protein
MIADLETAKSVLREYINGIIGFPAPGDAPGKIAEGT